MFCDEMFTVNDIKKNNLQNEITQSFIPIENTFNNNINEIHNIFTNILNESEKLIGSTDAFADQLGQKIKELILNIKKPEKISFQDITKYLESLDHFHRSIIYFGARWIRKIGFRHKLTITQIERDRRKLFQLTRDIKDLFQDYIQEMKKKERAEKIAWKISKLKSEQLNAKIKLDEIEKRIKKIEKIKDRDERKIQNLEEEKVLQKLGDFEKAESLVEDSIKQQLHYLEKPVQKSIRLIEKGSIQANKVDILRFQNFIENPKKIMLNAKNINFIEETLLFLQGLLDNKKLKLKSSRNRKASRIISTILKKSMIRDYHKQFVEYHNKKAKLEDTGVKEKSDEYDKTQANFKKSSDMISTLKKEKKKIQEDINSCTAKINEHHIKLETLLD